MKYEKQICQLAKDNDSFYIYDEGKIREQIRKLKKNFPKVEFLYSIKCNSHHDVVNTVLAQGLGADAASLGEVKMALEFGLRKEQIYYSAPGKSRNDLKEALSNSLVIADSIREIERISEISEETAEEIGIRIHPEVSFDGSQNVASKFGIDEAKAIEYLKNGLPGNIRVVGIHVHLKSQELSAENMRSYYQRILALSQRVEKAIGSRLKFINMGSGIGIPYGEGEQEIDLIQLGRETGKLLEEFHVTHPETKVFIETGRYVVCQSGVFVTHVVDRKQSCGKTLLILQNTLNGFLRPSLAQLVKKYAGGGNIKPAEPLFTSLDAFPIETLKENEKEPTEIVTLCGNLCTSADLIAEDIRLPKLAEGDLILIKNAGAYAAVLSPMQFSSQIVPPEYMIDEKGRVKET